MSPPPNRNGLALLRPPPTPEEALEELEFAEGELDRALLRATELERENERLRDENSSLARDLDEVKRAHFESANTNEVLSARLLAVQCRMAKLDAKVAASEGRVDAREHESEMAMARQIIAGLEAQCSNYESRVAEMKRQIGQLAAVIKAERAAAAIQAQRPKRA